MNRVVRSLHVLVVLTGLSGLVCAQLPARNVRPAAATRIVYLVGRLAEEDLLTLLSAAAAAEPAPLVLLDTTATAPHLGGALKAYGPERVVPVGEFAEAPAEHER